MTDQEKIEFLAEKVMGWHKHWSHPDYPADWVDKESGHAAYADWNPLLSISDAWMVVEKINSRLLWFHIECANGVEWSAKVFTARFDGEECKHVASAETAPLAICNAAISAVGGKP